MELEIKLATPDDIFGNVGYEQTFREYRDECSNTELGLAVADERAYRALTTAGTLCTGAAFRDGELVGFINVLTTAIPHYAGKRVGTVESLFLRKSERKGRAGLRLIAWAKAFASAQGCSALLISAPAGSSLERIGHKLWRHSNTVFSVGLE